MRLCSSNSLNGWSHISSLHIANAIIPHHPHQVAEPDDQAAKSPLAMSSRVASVAAQQLLAAGATLGELAGQVRTLLKFQLQPLVSCCRISTHTCQTLCVCPLAFVYRHLCLHHFRSLEWETSQANANDLRVVHQRKRRVVHLRKRPASKERA